MIYKKIEIIRNELIEFANLVELMVKKSVSILDSKDKSLISEIIDNYEQRANEKETDIDELCTNAIAQFAPKAKELRTILMSLQISNDLERMADHAVNITESAQYLIERPSITLSSIINDMSTATVSMLSDSVNSFIKEDSDLATRMCARDDEVDDYRAKILKEMISCMHNDNQAIERAMHVYRISQNLERIADLATNIGEDVLYMVEGRVIKHHLDEEGGK